MQWLELTCTSHTANGIFKYPLYFRIIPAVTYEMFEQSYIGKNYDHVNPLCPQYDINLKNSTFKAVCINNNNNLSQHVKLTMYSRERHRKSVTLMEESFSLKRLRSK